MSQCNTCKHQKSDGWCSLRNIYTLMGLTQECYSYEANNSELARRNALLTNENERLRRYVKMFAAAMSCDNCPYDDDFDVCDDTEVTRMSEDCPLYKELRALRIEVNE